METIQVQSISQIHHMLGFEPPSHPLITLLDVSALEQFDRQDQASFQTDLYTIALKVGSECDITYGRKTYDFNQGSLVFSEPGQVTTISSEGSSSGARGRILCFHPDLLAGSSLAKTIGDYTFFAYSNNEALHLSAREKETISSLVTLLETEYTLNLDTYSNNIITSNLEVLLNYCERFYGRQFITRKAVHLKGVAKFEALLKERMTTEVLGDKGIPTVKELADTMGYSSNYLSDLLMKETGRRTQDHIHDFIIKEAKNLLLGTNDTITQIAYLLGYEYPEHFGKLFKKKVGVTPSQFRQGDPG